LFPDERGGVFGNWRTGESYPWQTKEINAFSAEDLHTFGEKVKYAQVENQAHLESTQLESTLQAQKIWADAQLAKTHPYLETKKINPYGLKIDLDGRLIAPLFDKNDMIQSLQYINNTGEKKFFKGAKKKGGYFPIGILNERPIIICEGVATGASIHEAFNSLTIVAFDSGNLLPVAEIIRENYPSKEIIIAGDDDFKNKQNIGKESAINTAQVIHGKVTFPKFSEPRLDTQTDFNDMANSEGSFIVGIHFSDLEQEKPLGPKKFELGQFALNGESDIMMRQMLEDKYVLGQMAILGQFIVFYAEPNAGKTLLVIWLLIQSIESGEINGSDVFYINADDNHKGLIHKLKLAEEYGFNMLAPSYKGFESKKFRAYIETLIKEGSAKGKIIVLDTLKKFVDLMRKDIASAFGVTMRDFVAHGGTIIGLAHVNKHKNTEGKSIYAGTADITDDADCYYMIEVVQSNHLTKTIRFENQKSRGDVDKTATFVYTNQKVRNYQELLDSIKTMSESEAQAIAEINQMNARLTNNQEVIDAIKASIEAGIALKTPLVQSVAKTVAISPTKVKTVLDQHTGTDYKKGDRWNFNVGEKNARTYFLISTKGLQEEYRDQM
jgi:hypothetical protein